MFWEKVTIERASTIVIEKDLVRGVVKWSVTTANRIIAGEAATVAEAFAEAVAAANGQERKLTNETLREFELFDLFDR
jgi:hypothetical protein